MDEEKRPVCGCSKAECLRRYCECFSNMWFCSEECSCLGCRNTQDNEDEVEERAEIILKNRPEAFKPKIADAAANSMGRELRRHVKGCTCIKSECKKRYCECFKNKVGCSARCQCKRCGNSYGAKSDTQQFDENVNSNGTSDGTITVTDNEMYWPTEASMMENFVASGGPWDVEAMDDGGLENMFLKHYGGGDYFQHNVHSQTHQFAQAGASPLNSASSTLQGPSNHDACNVNNGSQSGFGRS